jgi:hemerythrin
LVGSNGSSSSILTIEALEEFANTPVNKAYYKEMLNQLINELKEHFKDAEEFL